MAASASGAGATSRGGGDDPDSPFDSAAAPPTRQKYPSPSPEAFMQWTEAKADSAKRVSPSAQRNSEPICKELARIVARLSAPAGGADAAAGAGPAPDGVRVLEVASGTGQHGAYMVAHIAELRWQPTEYEDKAFPSIAAYAEEAPGGRMAAPVALDASAGKAGASGWGLEAASFDVVFNANMVHISPWACAEGLFAGAAAVLKAGGVLFQYGPFNVDGAFTAPSNESFDSSLRARDAAWGIRDVAELEALAAGTTPPLVLEERVDMPANNFVLVWRKPAEGDA